MPDPGPQIPPASPQSPPAGGGEGVLLSRDAAGRTREVVNFVERTFLAPPGAPPRRQPRGGPVAARLVRLTGALAARSGATVHSAPAVFVSAEGGTLSDTDEEVTVWGLVDVAITSGDGRYALACWANGRWWVGVPGSCDFLG